MHAQTQPAHPALKPPYEVLSYEATIELLDAEGREAIYTKRERVRVLVDRLSTLYDYGWGDGIAFATIDVSPGTVTQRQLLGSRVRSRIELPEPKVNGEEFTFTIERTIRNGFLSPSECWLEAELHHEASQLSLRAVFPASRAVRTARLLRLLASKPKCLPVDVETDGRQCVSTEVVQPTRGERYTLAWDW